MNAVPQFSSSKGSLADAQATEAAAEAKAKAKAKEPKMDARSLEISRSFQASNPQHRITFEKVNLADLVVDPVIQRDEDPIEVAQIANNFNENALGTLTLSERFDVHGRRILVILDGQQRRAGALRVGYDQVVPALVHSNLTVPEEAKLFLDLNFRRAVNAWVRFRVQRIAGDPLAQAIWLILDELNIPKGGSRGFASVMMAMKVAKRDAGLLHLRWALKTVRDLYDDGDGGCYDGRVVEAFTILYRAHGTVLSEDTLRSRLAKYPEGTAGLIGHGQTVRKTFGGHIAPAIANAIVTRYNKYFQDGSKHALAPIGRGSKSVKVPVELTD